MGGFGDLFGGLGELLGGLADLGTERAVEAVVESTPDKSRGAFDAAMIGGRYLTGAKRVLDINDI